MDRNRLWILVLLAQLNIFLCNGWSTGNIWSRGGHGSRKSNIGKGSKRRYGHGSHSSSVESYESVENRNSGQSWTARILTKTAGNANGDNDWRPAKTGSATLEAESTVNPCGQHPMCLGADCMDAVCMEIIGHEEGTFSSRICCEKLNRGTHKMEVKFKSAGPIYWGDDLSEIVDGVELQADLSQKANQYIAPYLAIFAMPDLQFSSDEMPSSDVLELEIECRPPKHDSCLLAFSEPEKGFNLEYTVDLLNVTLDCIYGQIPEANSDGKINLVFNSDPFGLLDENQCNVKIVQVDLAGGVNDDIEPECDVIPDEETAAYAAYVIHDQMLFHFNPFASDASWSLVTGYHDQVKAAKMRLLYTTLMLEYSTAQTGKFQCPVNTDEVDEKEEFPSDQGNVKILTQKLQQCVLSGQKLNLSQTLSCSQQQTIREFAHRAFTDHFDDISISVVMDTKDNDDDSLGGFSIPNAPTLQDKCATAILRDFAKTHGFHLPKPKNGQGNAVTDEICTLSETNPKIVSCKNATNLIPYFHWTVHNGKIMQGIRKNESHFQWIQWATCHCSACSASKIGSVKLG